LWVHTKVWCPRWLTSSFAFRWKKGNLCEISSMNFHRFSHYFDEGIGDDDFVSAA
jgi:hypothetical protein